MNYEESDRGKICTILCLNFNVAHGQINDAGFPTYDFMLVLNSSVDLSRHRCGLNRIEYWTPRV